MTLKCSTDPNTKKRYVKIFGNIWITDLHW